MMNRPQPDFAQSIAEAAQHAVPDLPELSDLGEQPHAAPARGAGLYTPAAQRVIEWHRRRATRGSATISGSAMGGSAIPAPA